MRTVAVHNALLTGMICTLAALFAAPSAQGQILNESAKLLASDGAATDNFGFSVAISGDVAVVGAWMDAGVGTDSGSAYVYRWNGSMWVEEQKLTASDAAASDTFGESVSISGNVIVVGADQNDDGGSNSGSAYVYRWNGSMWIEEQKLLASDAAATDLFGGSVAVSGDVAVVGAFQNDDGGTNSGSAYVYRWNGASWVQEQKLLASDAQGSDFFGCAVSVSADVVVVGARGDDDLGAASGAAYVFRWNGSTWVEEEKLLPSDGAGSEVYGNAVDVDGDVIVVGAFNDDDNGSNSGSAFVYRWSGSLWNEEDKITASDAAAADEFGTSVSVSGDMVVVGAPENDDGGGASGSAYQFSWNGATWDQDYKLLPSDPPAGRFGIFVGVDGDVTIVGAYQNNETDSTAGAAYIFTGDCDPGYYGTNCDPCPGGAGTPCNNHGTCDDGIAGTGTCACNVGFVGAACDQCGTNYYNYPTCTFCLAATTCSGHGTCNSLGGCDCNTGFAGTACNQCAADYFNYPACTFCQAATTCSGHGTCNAMGGCNCNVGFAGTACDQCGANYYNYPTCTFCQAATTCSGNGTCNAMGGCDCNTGFSGPNCASDVNECDLDLDNCDVNATCTNIPGGFVCSCNVGYAGDGVTCIPLPAGACCEETTCTVTTEDLCTDSEGHKAEFLEGEVCEGIQACCLPDDACADIDATCCIAQNGIPAGPGTACLGRPQACCIDDGTCIFTDPTCCEEIYGGAAQGGKLLCGETQACCVFGGVCVEADSLCCEVSLDGTPLGSGTTCDAIEACCLPDGTCEDLVVECCLMNGGTPGGPGSSCDQTEACCLPDATCSDQFPLCCTENEGTPGGPGSSCDQTEACCLPGGMCEDQFPLCCVENGGTPGGPGTTCLMDGDGDGVPDACDICPLGDDSIDTDMDGVPDACDPCPNDNPDDTDGDGVCDSDDDCPGGDDGVDTDMDGVPDFCDICPGGDDNIDTDMDGVPDFCDTCPGGDDSVDTDMDGVPDFCDICPGGDDGVDTDMDGVPDFCDLCPGGNDSVDTDMDGVPDFCDTCPNDNPDDTDGDGVCDTDDVCPGDDNIDTDMDGIPNACDVCPFDNPNDSDGDGVCDSVDECPGGNDNADTDMDGVPNACDVCPLDNPNDGNGNGTPDCQEAEGVPTVSMWGLAILALLLLTAAKLGGLPQKDRVAA